MMMKMMPVTYSLCDIVNVILFINNTLLIVLESFASGITFMYHHTIIRLTVNKTYFMNHIM